MVLLYENCVVNIIRLSYYCLRICHKNNLAFDKSSLFMLRRGVRVIGVNNHKIQYFSLQRVVIT